MIDEGCTYFGSNKHTTMCEPDNLGIDIVVPSALRLEIGEFLDNLPTTIAFWLEVI